MEVEVSGGDMRGTGGRGGHLARGSSCLPWTHGRLETWALCLTSPCQGHKPLCHRQAAAHCHQ